MTQENLIRLVAEVQFELWLRVSAGAHQFSGAQFSREGVELHDIDGSLLVVRFPLIRDETRVGFVDVAMNPVLGGPLHSVTEDWRWDPGALLEEAGALASTLHPELELRTYRLELYSYPRVGVRFFDGEREVLVDVLERLEIRPRSSLEPGGWGNYESWSIVRRSEREGDAGRQAFEAWLAFGGRVLERFPECSSALWLGGVGFEAIQESFPEVRIEEERYVELCEGGEDENCFRFHPQRTFKWCVPACMEMMLDFFLSAEPTQEEIADQMGQGTLQQASELAASNRERVIREIEEFGEEREVSLSVQIEIDAQTVIDLILSEIRAGRPLFVLGVEHAWTVYGFGIVRVGGVQQLWLALFDPLPKDEGRKLPLGAYNSTLHAALVSVTPASES